MIKNNTPVESYKCQGLSVLVKREDLCVKKHGPPFSKVRGIYDHLYALKKKGVTTIGYTETSISMAGWGLAWIGRCLGMRVVIYNPQYKHRISPGKLANNFYFGIIQYVNIKFDER